MTPELLSLLDHGRFAEADRQLRDMRRRDDSPDVQVTAAEVLDRVGRPLEAWRLADRALTRERLSAALESRCLTVMGTVALEQGRAEESVRRLQSSVAIAKEARCTEQLCWAELRLLIAMFELSPSSAAAGMLAELRKHVAQLGDARVSAALHVFVSEVEAKRGAF